MTRQGHQRQQPQRRQGPTFWLPVFLLILLCTILFQLLSTHRSHSLSKDTPAPTDHPSSSSSSSSSAIKNSLFTGTITRNSHSLEGPEDLDNNHNPVYSKRKYPWQRRADDSSKENDDDEQEQEEEEDDDDDVHGTDKNLLLVNGFMPDLSSWGDSANDQDQDQDQLSSSSIPSSNEHQLMEDQQFATVASAHPLSFLPTEQRYRSMGIGVQRQVNVAQTVCNPGTPQSLGPAWNGTFASNSPDGVYPSVSKSCTWVISAANNSTTGTSSGTNPSPSPVTSPTASSSSPPQGGVTKAALPYIIAVSFSTPIQLVCGVDYLTLFDGPDATWPVIASVCGNIFMDSIPTYYSSGPVMTAVFSSQASTPGSFGFTANWSSILPCSVCVASGRGTCNGNSCVCSSKTSGVVCDQDTAGFKDFLPRSQHAMAYDPVKDMVYISGGTNAQNPFLGDLLTYAFASNKWSKINLSTSPRVPYPRYGHFAFVYNSELYIYGGVTVNGGMVDIWKYNGKQWLVQTPNNTDPLPVGRTGAACAVITVNNATMLVSFGGIDSNNHTVRDLFMYDINMARWRQSAHKNSVGLAGASAVFHQATQSIYFFGGMVNQTTRNTVVFQYSIQLDLWYELAPLIDPLTATPVTPFNGQEPSNPFNSSSGDGSDDDPGSQNSTSTSTTFLPPVMYDPISGVWAPAGLMGDDMVVLYGGMRPFGPGVNVRDQSCYVRKLSLYDLSCQKWTTFDVTDMGGVMHNRVNHTMVIRPPGAPGGSKTAYTAYIFGGFDGVQHADMLNVTLSVPIVPPVDVNNCRALRWCAHYHDCQYCNVNFCSYIAGLCLFDTDKAQTPLSSTAPPYLLGASTDIPNNGTFQDLVRQRPELKSQILTPGQCPTRIQLQLDTTYSNSIQSGQEMTFNIYIDSPNLDIQYEIRTNPAQNLNFQTLNVWEGFMNMYWRADHGLTDDSWNGYSETSAPLPPDLVDNSTYTDGSVISPAGFLNVSELANRWQRYSGLDSSPTASALTSSAAPYIYFPADDPRRFSGNYVFSLTNSYSTAISFTLTVSALDRPTPLGPNSGSKFNLASLGYFMIGFIICVLLLILLGRKIRQFLERRDLEMRAAAEARMLEEEEQEAEEEERRRLAAALRGERSGDMKDWKPMYKVVVGVQASKNLEEEDEDEKGWSSARNLSTTSLLTARPAGRGTADMLQAAKAGDSLLPRSHSDSAVPRSDLNSRPKSDFIRDLGSSPATSNGGDETLKSAPALLESVKTTQEEGMGRSGKKDSGGSTTTSSPSRKISIRLDRYPSHHQSHGLHHNNNTHGAQDDLRVGTGSTSLQRGWSLKSLGRSASLKRIREQSKVNPEETEGLTSSRNSRTPDLDPHQQQQQKHQEEPSSGQQLDLDDSDEQEVIELDVLSRQQSRQSSHGHGAMYSQQQQLSSESSERELAQQLRKRRRNPIRVQPISIEPLPFHGGLVARTRRNFKRYQRSLARSAAAQGTTRSSFEEERRRHEIRRANMSRSSAGSLRTAHGAALKMASLTRSRTIGSVEEEDNEKSPMPEAVIDISAMENDGPYDTGNPTAFGSSTVGGGSGTPKRKESEPSTPPTKKKPIRMRGRQEFEPGPLLAMNVLIVFPGDAGTRPLQTIGNDESGAVDVAATTAGISGAGVIALESIGEDQRLPPMAIGTVFVPDPVRWWAYRAQQRRDRLHANMQMKKKSQYYHAQY